MYTENNFVSFLPHCKGLIWTKSDMSCVRVKPVNVAFPLVSVPNNCHFKSVKDATCSAQTFCSSSVFSNPFNLNQRNQVQNKPHNFYNIRFHHCQFVEWTPIHRNWNSARFSTFHVDTFILSVIQFHFMIRHVSDVQN